MAFGMFLPMNLTDCLNGYVKSPTWRGHHDKRIEPQPKLDIKRHLFTSNEAPAGSMLQILNLDFIVKIPAVGKLVSPQATVR